MFVKEGSSLTSVSKHRAKVANASDESRILSSVCGDQGISTSESRLANRYQRARFSGHRKIWPSKTGKTPHCAHSKRSRSQTVPTSRIARLDLWQDMYAEEVFVTIEDDLGIKATTFLHLSNCHQACLRHLRAQHRAVDIPGASNHAPHVGHLTSWRQLIEQLGAAITRSHQILPDGAGRRRTTLFLAIEGSKDLPPRARRARPGIVDRHTGEASWRIGEHELITRDQRLSGNLHALQRDLARGEARGLRAARAIGLPRGGGAAHLSILRRSLIATIARRAAGAFSRRRRRSPTIAAVTIALVMLSCLPRMLRRCARGWRGCGGLLVVGDITFSGRWRGGARAEANIFAAR